MSRDILFAGLIVAGLASVAHAQQDAVFGQKGTPTKGTITSRSPTIVKMDVGGLEKSFNVNELRKVTFGDDPGELGRARDEVIAGRYAQAKAGLARIKDNVTQKTILGEIAFYKAYCDGKLALTGDGDKATAVAAMVAYVKDYQAQTLSHHFYDACELLGDLAVALGSFERAAQYYGVISKAPWPDYNLKGAILEAGALMSQQKYPDALLKFETIIAAPGDTAEMNRQKNYAVIGRATCLAETGNAPEGVKVIEEIILKNDPSQEPALFGRAYNALGRCHIKSNQFKEALIAYLYTDLLFSSDGEAHAEALSFLAKLWGHDSIKKPDRAVAARSLLQERYPGSPWNKGAR